MTAAWPPTADAELLGEPAGHAPCCWSAGSRWTPPACRWRLSDHRYLAHRFSLEVEFRGWSGAAAGEPPGLRSHTPDPTTHAPPTRTEETAR